MKKILMSTTAIALIAASSAASAGDGLKLGVTGSIKSGLVFFSKEKTGDNEGVVTETGDSYGLKTKFALDFAGTETFDNGVILGAKISFNTKTADATYSKVYLTVGYESIGSLHFGSGVSSIGDTFDYTVGSVSPYAIAPAFDATKYSVPELQYGLSVDAKYKPVSASFVSASFMGLSGGFSFHQPTTLSGSTSVVSDEFKEKILKVDSVGTSANVAAVIPEGFDDVEIAYASAINGTQDNSAATVPGAFTYNDQASTVANGFFDATSGGKGAFDNAATFGTVIYRKDLHKAVEVPVDPTYVVEGAAGISYSYADISLNVGGGYSQKGYKAVAADELFGIDSTHNNGVTSDQKVAFNKALAKAVAKYLVAKTSDTLLFVNGNVEYQGIVLGGGFSQLDTKSGFVTDDSAEFDDDGDGSNAEVAVSDEVASRTRNFELGAKYTLNALSFSVAYAQKNVSRTNTVYEKTVVTTSGSLDAVTYQKAGGKSQTRTYGVSGAYKIVEGLDVGVDFNFYNGTSSLATKKDTSVSGWYGSLSTKVSF